MRRVRETAQKEPFEIPEGLQESEGVLLSEIRTVPTTRIEGKAEVEALLFTPRSGLSRGNRDR